MRHHPKVEALKERRAADLANLYYRQPGSTKELPKYGGDLMREKTRDIEAAYDAALVALMDAAQLQHDAAGEVLAEIDRPYNWLTPDELTRAVSLAPFIREDLATLDAAGVVAAVKTAAASNRIEKWLIHRYAPRRVDELDASQETALNMSQRAHIVKDLPALRDSMLPPSRLKDLSKARDDQKDAQTLHDAAEWARPSTRQEFAARMGFNVEHVPE